MKMIRRLCVCSSQIFLFMTLFSAGCTQIVLLHSQIDTVKKEVEKIEKNGAYICAPRELAVAKANLEFATLEISQGNGKRAAEHFKIARTNATMADELSPPDKCAGPAVVVDECLDEDKDSICDDGDIDSDGVLDGVDQCMLDAEDLDAFLDEDGCPDFDNDNDGVFDEQDECDEDLEDPDGFRDEDGCPDLDNDRDTVLDLDDACPNQAGEPDENGCLKKYDGIEITKTHIKIDQKIHFASNTAKIKRPSHWILSQVVKVLEDYPKIMLSIEGHTDDKGRDKYNLELSSKRAEAVRKYLIDKGGIDSNRLTSQGFGEKRPVEPNTTKEGRAVNRRVEFVRKDTPNQE